MTCLSVRAQVLVSHRSELKAPVPPLPDCMATGCKERICMKLVTQGLAHSMARPVSWLRVRCLATPVPTLPFPHWVALSKLIHCSVIHVPGSDNNRTYLLGFMRQLTDFKHAQDLQCMAHSTSLSITSHRPHDRSSLLD